MKLVNNLFVFKYKAWVKDYAKHKMFNKYRETLLNCSGALSMQDHFTILTTEHIMPLKKILYKLMKNFGDEKTTQNQG